MQSSGVLMSLLRHHHYSIQSSHSVSIILASPGLNDSYFKINCISANRQVTDVNKSGDDSTLDLG